MSAEETTASKYRGSSQHSFIKTQYVLSAELYEASQARQNDKGGSEEEQKSKGFWMVDESFTYWKEISH